MISENHRKNIYQWIGRENFNRKPMGFSHDLFGLNPDKNPWNLSWNPSGSNEVFFLCFLREKYEKKDWTVT